MDKAVGEPLKPCHGQSHHHNDHRNLPPPTSLKASDALPLPLYLTNGLFFGLFFSVAYFLLHRWREKIRNSTPLHILTFPEIAGIICLASSVVYLLGFFGIGIAQSFISRGSQDSWDVEEDHMTEKKSGLCAAEICSGPAKSPAASLAPVPSEKAVNTMFQSPMLGSDDEEVIKGSIIWETFLRILSNQSLEIAKGQLLSVGKRFRE
ncbi:hypothetical protein OIU78_025325 [Salix suchowensis]|nr:hypothetical protein OIU78_025325 [Salix suchowensis]